MLNVPANLALSGPIDSSVVTLKTLSLSRTTNSQPGMHCDSRAVSKRLRHTRLRGAKKRRSPVISMVRALLWAQSLLFLIRSRASSVAFTIPE